MKKVIKVSDSSRRKSKFVFSYPLQFFSHSTAANSPYPDHDLLKIRYPPVNWQNY